MVKHYNPSIVQDALRIFNTKSDNLSDDLGLNIIPVIPVTPCARVVGNAAATNATSATILTTPTGRDFYLTGAALSMIKDVTSTSNSSTIRCVINGVTVIILDIAGITLTAQSATQTVVFNPPLKIDAGTNITVQNATNTANVRSDGCIYGYTQETTAT